MAIPQIPSQGPGDSTKGPLTDCLVDEMLAHYIDWRRDAAAAAVAYRSWCEDTAGDGGASRFSAYMAALDQEESSAQAYAIAVTEVERALQCDQSVPERI